MKRASILKSTMLALAVLGASPLVMAEDLRNFMSVSGECLKSVSQDRGAVTLTADFLDASAGTAAKKATRQYNDILDRVKKMNLKDAQIETSEYSVNEDFDYTPKGERKSRGFRARNGLRIETSEIERMGEVIKIGTDLGVKSISSLSMFVSQQKWKTERESCLEEAYQNAKSKADRLSRVSGVKIKGVARMDESGSSSPLQYQRSFYSEAKMGGARSDEAQIQSRSESLQVNLSVQFLIQ